MSRWTSTRPLRIAGTLVLTVCLLIALSCTSFGAERETKVFNVDVKVGVDNSYEFTETLETVFHSPGHGIYRYVPEYYNGTKEKVRDGWCNGYPIETYSENGNYVLQIGDGDRYLTGDQTFVLGYDITMLDDRDTSSDLLYINVLPTGWQTPIGSTKVTMELPKSIKDREMRVYYGKRGSTETVPAGGADGIRWNLSDDGKLLTIKGSGLDQGVGITVMVDLPEGYWEGQANTNWMKYAAMLALLVMAGLYLLFWRSFGRNRKPVETVEFYPPEGMTPAEVGYIADGSLDRKDMVSMFMYFAHKGYMTITPDGKKDFILRKVREIDENEKKFARTLFQGIFSGKSNEKRLSDLGNAFARKYQTARATLDAQLDPVPRSSTVVHYAMKLLLFVGAIGIGLLADSYVVGHTSSAAPVGAGLMMPLFALLLCRGMRKRRIHEGIIGKLPFLVIFAALDLFFLYLGIRGVYTDFEGVIPAALYGIVMLLVQYLTVVFYKVEDDIIETLGRLLGLRRFIQTAEAPRIRALVEENPDYFYDILPYAYVMGVTKKWAKRFENVPVEPPFWYGGAYDAHTFNTIYFMDSMNHFGHAVNSNASFVIPDTSGSSGFSGGSSFGGFSGGGFSGGGFGGGGGGFW